jgi:ribose transport system substrate-binding protein
LRKNSKLTLLVILIVIGITIFGVYGNAFSKDKEHYVFVAYVTSIPFWEDGVRGFNAAGELLGVETSFTGPVKFDAQAQARTIEELIAKGVDGIAIAPADPNVLIEPLERAMKEGIPVIEVNSEVYSDKASYGYVGINNYPAGVLGGELAVQILGEKGKVAILTMPGVTVHEDRKRGYLEILEKYPEIEIVSIANTQADPSIGVEKAGAIIQAYPDLDMFIGTDATSGAAAARAVLEAGKEGEIKIIGMDRDQDLLNFIEMGVVNASLGQRTFLEEWTALHYLYWLNHDMIKDIADWRGAGVSPVPSNTDTGAMIITQDNVDQFMK